MERLTTIALDAAPTRAPPQWTPDWVQRRLVEAFSVERRMPGGVKRRAAGAWPAISYEFSDVVGWTDARDRVLDNWANTRESVFSAEISRMEAAHEWLRVILANYEIERTCLAQWAACIAYRRSLRDMLARKRWARATFYRKVAIGSLVIAIELERRGDPVC